MSAAICAHPGCDLGEEEHHAFVARKCQCDPSDWRGNNVPDVCPTYVDCNDELCVTCYHPEECHPPKAETATEKERPTT